MRRSRGRVIVMACVMIVVAGRVASAAEETPAAPDPSAPPSARTDWEAQGEWLVNTAHRCQLRTPAAEGWALAQDATAGWVIARRAPEATVEVLCEVRETPAAPRQMIRAAVDHAYGRTDEAHYFLPQARFRQRQVTFQGAGAIRLWIEGPYSTGAWRADTYLIFRRKHLLVMLHATATPKGAYEAQRQAIDEVFNSLTWF